jgi:hypothetical protein
MHHFVSLRVLVLMSNPGWLSLFLTVLIEGGLQSYRLGSGVELDHLPILALPAQWRLHGWTVVPIVPLGVQSQFNHTYPLAFLLVSLLFPAKHLVGLP